MIALFVTACFPVIDSKNFPPYIEVVEPTEEIFQENESIDFYILAANPEGTGISVSIQSSVDGIFYEGVPDGDNQIQFSTQDLSIGEHAILAVASDPEGFQSDFSLSLTINGQPESPSLIISPEQPDTRDELLLIISEGADPEGEIVTHNILWKQNGVVVDGLTDSPSVAAENTTRGDIWQATATPTDGSTSGIPETITVEIVDGPPEIEMLKITPDTDVRINSSLLCEANTSDIDNDTVTTSFAWRRVVDDIVSELSTGGETISLSPEIAQPNDKYLCEGTAESNGLTVQESTWIQITNSLPVIVNQEILSYGPINASAEIFCSADISDPDGSNLSVDYEWRLNGSQILGLEYTLELPEQGITRNDVLSCAISANDPHGGESTALVEVTIENSPPVLDTVLLSPSFPKTPDVITCTPTASDLDGDSIVYVYNWFRNGVPLSETGNTLSTTLNVNDTVECVVIPSDGQENGDELGASATVSNTTPTITSLDLTPTQAYTNTTLVATVSSVDVDGDTVSTSYEWWVNGAAVLSGPTNSLSGSTHFEHGDQVWVLARPYDGRDYGDVSISSQIVVDNSTPQINNLQLGTSSAIRRGQIINCLADISDADTAQSLTTTYSWTDDAGLVLGTGSSFAITGQHDLYYGDQLSCTISVDDGLDSITETVSADVENTAPAILTVSIGPGTAFPGDLLTCSPVADDIDGQTLSFSYQWFINGVLIDETSDTLDYPFDSADIVSCFAEASDGIDSSQVASGSITISNHPPVITSIDVFPNVAYANSTLNAVISAYDSDNDVLTYGYGWEVNGVIIQSGIDSALVYPSLIAGDVVRVRGRAYDTLDNSGPTWTDPQTIRNAPPTGLAIRVTPSTSTPLANPLQCELISTPSDIDNDTLTYTILWARNGVPWEGNGAITTTTVYTGDTIPALLTENGDVWTCTVEVSDGVNPPLSESASAYIECGIDYGMVEECPALSCLDVIENDPSLQGINGIYHIKVDVDTYPVYCDMSHDGGGWTLLMTTYIDDGNINSPYGPFTYDDNVYWITNTTYNQEFLSSNADAPTPEFSKYQSFGEVTGNALRLNVQWDTISVNLDYDNLSDQTALDVFSGPELLIQGEPSLGCHGELLSDLEITNFFGMGRGLQMYGFNINDGYGNIVRFGVIHGSSTWYSTFTRVIGIGTGTYSARLGLNNNPSNCGNSGSNYSGTGKVLMDFWVR